MAAAKRILLVEEQPVTREGLMLAVRSALPASQFEQAGSGAEAAALLASGPFDLILYDFNVPGGGMAELLRIRAAVGEVPLLVMCARCEPLLVKAIRDLNVAGLVDKAEPLPAIAAAVRRVAAGDRSFPQAKGPAEALSALSPAQLRVLAALGTGQLNKQIADDLGVTEATVKAHLSAVFRKLGVTNRTQALVIARSLADQRAV